MAKTATEVMQDVIFAAVMDGIASLKVASKGLPNALLRDINAIHPNAALKDLPAELQAAIAESVRTAFQKLQREGYTVGNGQPAPAPPRPPMPNRPRGATRPPEVETRRRPPTGPGGGPRRPPKPR